MLLKDTFTMIAMVVFMSNTSPVMSSYAEKAPSPTVVESTEENYVIIEEPEPEPEQTSVIYQIPLSEELQEKTQYYLKYMGSELDQTYIYALIYHESGFNSHALGRQGDSGYCQILQRYFGSFYDSMKSEYPELVSDENLTKDIFNEKTNIACGIWYLNNCSKEVSGQPVSSDNISAALTSYNRGPGNAKKYFRRNSTYSTSYSKKIINYAESLQTTGMLPKK